MEAQIYTRSTMKIVIEDSG